MKTDLKTLHRIAGTTSQGTTLAGLQQAAQKMGLKAEGVQVSREALPDVSTPAIACLPHHYVVLHSLGGRGDLGYATIQDPNQDHEETLSQESLLQKCSGFLLLVHR